MFSLLSLGHQSTPVCKCYIYFLFFINDIGFLQSSGTKGLAEMRISLVKNVYNKGSKMKILHVNNINIYNTNLTIHSKSVNHFTFYKDCKCVKNKIYTKQFHFISICEIRIIPFYHNSITYQLTLSWTKNK